MEIRGKTISYSSYIKKQTNIEEKRLLEELEELGKIDNPSDENLRQIDTVKDNLLNIRNKRMEGVAIRTKTKWIDKGEKATRYFCNLENRNFTNRSISFLERPSGETLHQQEDILNEVTNFYSNLYEEKTVQNVDLNQIIKDAPFLNDEEIESLNGKLTYQEAAKVLSNMKNNKSPGPDGFTAEFF